MTIYVKDHMGRKVAITAREYEGRGNFDVTFYSPNKRVSADEERMVLGSRFVLSDADRRALIGALGGIVYEGAKA